MPQYVDQQNVGELHVVLLLLLLPTPGYSGWLGIRNPSSEVYKRGLDSSTELYNNLQFPASSSFSTGKCSVAIYYFYPLKSRFPDSIPGHNK